MLYALLDKSATIRTGHLKAAMAVWDYCQASAAYIFGLELGNKHAKKILNALRNVAPDGLTRTDIRDQVFRQNILAEDMQIALEILMEHKLVRKETKLKEGAKQHPAEYWYSR